MNLGENIYLLRTQKNMSQGDLADLLEVSRQSVSKWENNSATPELDKLLKMSELFGVSLDELVSGEKPTTPRVQALPELPSRIPARKVVGGLLFACAFLTFLLVGIFVGMEEGCLLSIPFAMCAVACFVFTRHTGLACAWAIYLPLALGSSYMTGYSTLIPGNILNFLFVQLPLLIYTVAEFRKDKLILIPRYKILLVFGWTLWFGYLILILSQPYSHHANAIHFLIPYGLLNTAHFCLLAILLNITYRSFFSK